LPAEKLCGEEGTLEFLVTGGMPQLAFRRNYIDVPDEYDYVLNIRVLGAIAVRTAAGRNPAVGCQIIQVGGTWLGTDIEPRGLAIHLSAKADNNIRTIRVRHPRRRIKDPKLRHAKSFMSEQRHVCPDLMLELRAHNEALDNVFWR
jgi:hypothetical protein